MFFENKGNYPVIPIYACDDSCVFVVFTVNIDKFSNCPFNGNISFIVIPLFHVNTIYLYTPKEIVTNTTSYDHG